MFISVITPIYNVEKYLATCIESVQKQTFQDWEMILVDDGSTDNSGAICDQYAINNAKIQVQHKQNGGLSSARNAGLKVASGEFVYFLDSDDYLSTSSSLQQVYQCVTQTAADVIFIEHATFLENKNELRKADCGAVTQERVAQQTRANVVNFLVENQKFPISAWSKVVRRSILMERNITFDEGVQVGEDFEWSFQLMNANPKIAKVDSDFMTYRIRDSSLCGVRNPIGWKSRYNLIERWMHSELVAEHKKLGSYLAYQYYLMLGDIHNIQDKTVRETAYKQAKSLRSITKQADTRRTKACQIALCLLGQKNAAALFDAYMKRNRK